MYVSLSMISIISSLSEIKDMHPEMHSFFDMIIYDDNNLSYLGER